MNAKMNADDFTGAQVLSPRSLESRAGSSKWWADTCGCCPRGSGRTPLCRSRELERHAIEEVADLIFLLPGHVNLAEETHFSGIVLDYDGTLCDAHARFGELDKTPRLNLFAS